MSTEKWHKKYLTDEELIDIIAHLSDSEDSFDDSNDENVDEAKNIIKEVDLQQEFDIESLPIEFDDGILLLENNEVEEVTISKEIATVNTVCPNNEREERDTKKELKELKERYSKIVWKKKNLILDEESKAFRGSTKLPTKITDLTTPYTFFKYFFDDVLIKNIVDQSNLYAIQVNPNKPANITPENIKQYLAICIYMSVVHMPNVRSYWSTTFGYRQIKEIMSEKEFEHIRRFLHFNDNTKMLPKEDPNHDRLHKLRPIIDALNAKFQSVPLEQFLSVDEQLCATKARHYLKQYMPAKPHKWGYKLYVLCGTDGFSYNFEIYSGTENDSRFRKDSEPDLGSCANIVVRLCRIVPKNENYRVYFDNFYTSVPLQVYLAKNGIYSLGTVRRARIPNCKLPDENKLKKENRGKSYEYVGYIDGVEISSVVWKDNKIVTLLSTHSGQLPETEVERYDKKENESKMSESYKRIQSAYGRSRSSRWFDRSVQNSDENQKVVFATILPSFRHGYC